jgi:hypothetical protein
LDKFCLVEQSRPYSHVILWISIELSTPEAGFSDFVPGLPSETPNLTKIASGLLERTSYWRYIAVSQAGVGHPDAGRLLSDGLVDK